MADTDPWAEFTPKPDPWAEFAPASRPRLGMGDVQAAPSSVASTANVPIGAQTGDPATDLHIAQNLAARGYRAALTPGDALRAGAAAAGLGLAALPGAPALIGSGAMLSGATSEADTIGGAAMDAAKGGAGAALLGGAGRVIGAGARKLLAPIARKGAAMVARGTARAAQTGAEEATAPVRSVEGAARERAANAYRQPERMKEILADAAVPEAEKQALREWMTTPEYAALMTQNARNVLPQAQEALAELEAARAIAQQARADLPEAIRARTAELLTPQVGADVRSFLKAYAEPVAWAVGGQQIGNALGLDPQYQLALAGALGLIGGRTRAGKALVSRVTRPAHQVAIGNALRRVGSPPAVPPSAARGAAVTLTPEARALLDALRGRPGFAPAAAEEDQ